MQFKVYSLVASGTFTELFIHHHNPTINSRKNHYFKRKLCTPVRMGTIRNLQTTNAGEGVEKREPSCTVDGNVN